MSFGVKDVKTFATYLGEDVVGMIDAFGERVAESVDVANYLYYLKYKQMYVNTGLEKFDVAGAAVFKSDPFRWTFKLLAVFDYFAYMMFNDIREGCKTGSTKICVGKNWEERVLGAGELTGALGSLASIILLFIGPKPTISTTLTKGTIQIPKFPALSPSYSLAIVRGGSRGVAAAPAGWSPSIIIPHIKVGTSPLSVFGGPSVMYMSDASNGDARFKTVDQQIAEINTKAAELKKQLEAMSPTSSEYFAVEAQYNLQQIKKVYLETGGEFNLNASSVKPLTEMVENIRRTLKLSQGDSSILTQLEGCLKRQSSQLSRDFRRNPGQVNWRNPHGKHHGRFNPDS